MSTPAREGITTWSCVRGGHTYFPRPLMCAHCRDTEFVPVPTRTATVEEGTFSPASGIHIVTLRTASGVRLVGRVPAAVPPGTDIALAVTAGIPHTAFVPGGE